MKKIDILKHVRICREDHGAELNSATVYGHHGSKRICIRLKILNVWIYDPAWEK